MAHIGHLMRWVSQSGGGACGVIFNIVASASLLGVCLDCFSAFKAAYNRACIRLENESWLRKNCRDPVFFSNMRAHTTVCAEVEANARVGAVWAAAKEVSENAKIVLQPVVPYIFASAVAFLFIVPLSCLCFQRLGGYSSHAYGRGRCIPIHRQCTYLKDV